jgi:hypothetical protein
MLSESTQIAIESIPTNKAQLIEAQIPSDANVMDFACDKGRDRVKLMYEEMLLKGH